MDLLYRETAVLQAATPKPFAYCCVRIGNYKGVACKSRYAGWGRYKGDGRNPLVEEPESLFQRPGLKGVPAGSSRRQSSYISSDANLNSHVSKTRRRSGISRTIW